MSTLGSSLDSSTTSSFVAVSSAFETSSFIFSVVLQLPITKELIKIGRLAFEADEDHHGRDEYRARCLEEIIQRLLEFDELKRVIHDTVDTAIELYSFLFAVTGEDDSEGSFESMEE